MSEKDMMLDQQVHDAFEGIRMSDEAQDRMLGALLAAQAQRAGEGDIRTDAPEATVRRAPTQQEDERPAQATRPAQRRSKAAHLKMKVDGTKPARRWSTWKMVLPLAAVLVVGAVVIRMQMVQSAEFSRANEIMEPTATEKTLSAESATGAMADEAVSDDAAEDMAFEAEEYSAETEGMVEPLAPEVIGSGGTPGSKAGLYPRIKMADGTLLTALVEGDHAEEVDAARVGTSLGKAQASPFDVDEPIDCEVFSLVDDPDGFAVRFEGEQGYWYCTRL